MNSSELIKKKRDGESLTEAEINFLISGYTENKIPDYQFSAFLMAAFINGMNVEETSFLTKAMLHRDLLQCANDFAAGKRIMCNIAGWSSLIK